MKKAAARLLFFFARTTGFASRNFPLGDGSVFS